MENNNLEDRKVYLDILRIIATFAVVLLHVSSSYWEKIDINSFEWSVFVFYDSFVRWGVGVFVMISGVLFLNKSKTIKELFKNHILRMVIAFVFWSAIYTIPEIMSGAGKKYIIYYFLKGNYHLWFLYMITGLYIITPFLKKIIEDENLTKYFLILALIFAVLITYVISIVYIFSPSIGSFMQQLINKTNLYMVLGFPIYYILGYVLDKKTINTKVIKLIYFFGIVGFILTFVFTRKLSLYKQKPDEVFFGNLTLNVFLECIFVFILIKNKCSKLCCKNKKILFILSKYSFGVYLVHALIIKIFDKVFNINTMSFNAVFSVPVLAIIVFIISYILSAILNKIPKLNKYIC